MLDYFLKQSTNLGFRRYRRNKSFINYDDIKDILILFDINEWNDIFPIVKDLRKDGKNVIAWTFKGNNNKAISKIPNFVRIIDPCKDLTWMRMIKPEIMEKFERLSYDTLLDLSSPDNKYLSFLLSRNKSKFCIGMNERKYKVYDFILLRDKEDKLYELYFQLKNYLKQIQ